MSRSTLITYVALGICTALLASNAGAVEWTTTVYQAKLDAAGIESESYSHSLVWSKDMTPLPQPYLYSLDEGYDKGLVFADYQGRDAELCYAFTLPSSQTQRVVKATVEIVVSFPSNKYISQYSSGTLSCQTSPNGMDWSIQTFFGEGVHQIDVDCPEGTCYLRFCGKRAMINYLSVSRIVETAAFVLSYDPGYGVLQAAIDAARNGTIIEVSKGTYSGPIDFKGKSITLRSASGPQATFINAGGISRAVRIPSGNPVLAGFTIQGGRVSADGGGVYVESGSPTIANCIVKDCTANAGGGIAVAAGAAPLIINCTVNACTAVRGGGIAVLTGADAKIIDCTIDGNTLTGAGQGGGLYCLAGEATLSGCRISNHATGVQTGGGVYCTTSTVVLKNSLIVSNKAGAASGLHAAQSNVTLSNCTVANNSTTAGSGGGVQSSASDVKIRNSIIWGNGGTPVAGYGVTVTYSDVEYGWDTGEGNLNEDPLFVGAGDFHLQSRYGRYNPLTGSWVPSAGNSPCLDAGDPITPNAVEPNPRGDGIDLGAYGASPQASWGPSHRIYHVAISGGSDSNGWGLSKDQPFRTIRKAVEQAQAGDTVLIWPGTYELDAANEVNVGKAIRIQSAADPAIITAKNGYAFSFYSGEGSNSVLSNLIIKGCRIGAIFCSGASPTLKNLTIVSNPCGVLAESNANPTIVNCLFWANGDKADVSQDSAGRCNPSYSLVNRKLNGSTILDPCFADAINGDYHLKSKTGRYVPSSDSWVKDTVSSPCINQGDPLEWPPGAELMPNGGRIDVGAHGGTPYASLDPNNWPSY